MKKTVISFGIVFAFLYGIAVKEFKIFPYTWLYNTKKIHTDQKKYLPARKPDKILLYKEIDGVKLNLHIFNPENHNNSNKTPAIIFFFGGSWKYGTPRQFYPQCEYLSAHGMVCISAEYRVENRHKTSPKECVKDARSAIRWVRKNTEILGINPEKLAAGGASAGGQIAAAAGVSSSFDEDYEDKNISGKPQALVLYNPVFDNGPDGYGYKRVKAYWREFSPIHNINSEAPPTVIFLGTDDHYIPVETAKKYQLLMEKNNIRCDLHLYEGQKHAFFNKERFQETIIETKKFLWSLGYIKTTSKQ